MRTTKRLPHALWVILPAVLLLAACAPRSAAAESGSSPTAAASPLPSQAPSVSPAHQPTWTVFTDSNNIHAAAFAPDGTLWAGGPGGVTAWDIDSGASTHYTVLDGLSTNQVNDIAVTPDGQVWLATNEGINRFDGTTWSTFTTADGLTSKWVTSLAVSPEGTLWAGSRYAAPNHLGGLAYFTGSGWQPRTCDNGLDDGILSIAFGADGSQWLVTGIGLLYLQTPDEPCDALDVIGPADGLPDGVLFDVLVTQAGEVWVASDSGAARLDGSTWRIYTTRDGLVHNQVFDIEQAPDGKLWFATPGGFSSFDGVDWESFAAGEFHEDNLVYALAFSLDNRLWAGTQTGLVHFDGQTRQRFLVGDSLPLSAPDVLAIDPGGNVWAGGSDLGFLRYDGQQWERLATGYDSSNQSIQSIAFGPDHSAWVSSWQGVTHYVGNETQTFDWPDGPVDNSPHPLAASPDGALWAGGGRGLLRLNNGAWEQVFPPEKTGVIYALLVDPDESLWLGTEGSLDHYNGKQITSDNARGWLESNQALALLRSPEVVLVVGTSNGLLSWDGSTWTQYPVEGRVQALTMGADGAVWASVDAGGVLRYDGQTWETFTTADGLVDNEIRAIAAAPDGSIWFTSLGGIGRYEP